MQIDLIDYVIEKLKEDISQLTVLIEAESDPFKTAGLEDRRSHLARQLAFLQAAS